MSAYDDNKDNEYTAQERITVMLGLLADSEAPVGPRPDLKEIQDWHLGKLDEARADEVKSHVARDPACFQLWSELLAAEATDEHEQPVEMNWLAQTSKKIKTWMTTPSPSWVGGGLATAMVIVLAVIIVPEQRSWSPTDEPISVDMEAQWPYLGKSITRGGKLSYRNKVAFQTGISEGIKLSTQNKQSWAHVLEYLHDTPQVCDDAKDKILCETQAQLMKKTGLHASVLYMACLERETVKTKAYNNAFWQNQTRAWETIGEDLNDNNFQEAAKIAHKLNQLGDNRDSQCRLVRDLINLVY